VPAAPDICGLPLVLASREFGRPATIVSGRAAGVPSVITAALSAFPG